MRSQRRLLARLRRFRDGSGQYRKRLLECPVPPLRLWIEPTSLCNLRCITCPTGRGSVHDPGAMGLDLYRKIIDEAAGFAADVNLIGRGDALLHPGIAEMVGYASGRGLHTRLETNATLLTPAMSEALISAGLGFISFSFDGYEKETYESIRRGADFEKTLRNILDFLAVKKRLRRAKPYTILQFIESAPFAAGASRGAERRFKRRFRGLPLDAYRHVTPHRYAGEIEEGLAGTKYGFVRSGGWAGRLMRIRYAPCMYPWCSLHIYWDGTVLPCCMDFHARFPLGNVRETRLLDLWNSERMRELRGRLAGGRYRESPLCASCDMLYQRTLGGIPVKNIADFLVWLKENLVRGPR